MRNFIAILHMFAEHLLLPTTFQAPNYGNDGRGSGTSKAPCPWRRWKQLSAETWKAAGAREWGMGTELKPGRQIRRAGGGVLPFTQGAPGGSHTKTCRNSVAGNGKSKHKSPGTGARLGRTVRLTQNDQQGTERAGLEQEGLLTLTEVETLECLEQRDGIIFREF